MPSILKFGPHLPAPSYDHPAEDRRVAGNPLRTTWNLYDSSCEQLACGIWACEPGSWNIRFAENKDEFFSVIEGLVRLHRAEDGAVVEVGPGEAAVIPAGFVGRFEVVVPVRKYYVIHTRTSSVLTK